MSNLGTAYQAVGRLDEALPLLRGALEIMSATQGADHPKTIIAMINLAECYRAHGETNRALPLLEDAVRLIRGKPAADFSLTLGAFFNLATAYRDTGDHDRALSLYRETATLLESRGFDHRVAGRIVEYFTGLLERTKRFDEAETWHRKWLAAVKKKSGADSSAYAGVLEALGTNLILQEDWSAAEPVLREALALLKRKAPESLGRFNVQSLLGGALLGQKRYADAEAFLVLGYEGTKAREGQLAPPERRRLVEGGERIVRLYEAWGQANQAAKWRSRLAGPGASEPKP
jgi:tetratricopeptide (TPR) repeat protein